MFYIQIIERVNFLNSVHFYKKSFIYVHEKRREMNEEKSRGLNELTNYPQRAKKEEQLSASEASNEWEIGQYNASH